MSNLTIKEHRNRVAILEMVRVVEGELTKLRDLRLSGEYDEGQAGTPLLDAFAHGFYLGTMDYLLQVLSS